MQGVDDSARFRDFIERASKSVLINSASAKLRDPAEVTKLEHEVEQCEFRAVKIVAHPKDQRVKENETTEEAYFCKKQFKPF